MFFIGFPILSYLIRPYTTTSIGYSKSYVKPNQSNLLSELNTDHNTLWVKHHARQKAESIRATLFQSWTARSTTTLSSIQSILNSPQNVGAPSFSEPYLCKQPPLHSPPKIRSSTSANFHLLSPPLLVHKFILTIPLTLPFSIPHQSLTFLLLRTTIPTIYTKNVFPLSYLANSGYVKGPKSCEDWHCFDISNLPQSMDNDSSLEDDACNRNDKPFNPPSPIPSTYCHYFHTLLIPSQKLTFLWKPVA